MAQAQNSLSPTTPLEQAENELKSLIDQMMQSSDINETNELNTQLQYLFFETFDSEEALMHPFTELYAVSDLLTEDKKFRIITWELENEPSKITYYGVLSYVLNNEVYTHILADSSRQISNPELVRNSPQKWFGAMYYEMKKYTYRNQQFITLLGINRNQTLTKMKVVDVIELTDNLKFGADVFLIPNATGLKRKIYTYAVEADMSIWFDHEEDRILMDHLSPLSAMHAGKNEYYVPDLSFDSFTFKKGRFVYEADVDAKMEKNLKDRYFDMELPKQEKVY